MVGPMPNTLLALIIAAVAVLPGFVTAELTQRQRAVQPSGDGQSVVLRALDDARRPVAPLDPPRGMWVAKEGIAELYLFDIDQAR
jgi:hypothetical protein